MCQLFIIDYCIEACRLREKRRSTRALDSSPFRKVGQNCGVTDVKALSEVGGKERFDDAILRGGAPGFMREADESMGSHRVRRLRHQVVTEHQTGASACLSNLSVECVAPFPGAEFS